MSRSFRCLMSYLILIRTMKSFSKFTTYIDKVLLIKKAYKSSGHIYIRRIKLKQIDLMPFVFVLYIYTVVLFDKSYFSFLFLTTGFLSR